MKLSYANRKVNEIVGIYLGSKGDIVGAIQKAAGVYREAVSYFGNKKRAIRIDRLAHKRLTALGFFDA